MASPENPNAFMNQQRRKQVELWRCSLILPILEWVSCITFFMTFVPWTFELWQIVAWRIFKACKRSIGQIYVLRYKWGAPIGVCWKQRESIVRELKRTVEEWKYSQMYARSSKTFQSGSEYMGTTALILGFCRFLFFAQSFASCFRDICFIESTRKPYPF